jgi:hypothetical protein
MKLNLNLCFVTKGQPVNILWEQQYIDNLVAMQLPCIDHALSMPIDYEVLGCPKLQSLAITN